MTRQKNETYLLVGLLVVLAVVLYFLWGGNQGGGLPSFAAVDSKFEPLKVEDPQLRLDLLDRVRHAEYKGEEHNIFTYAPPQPTAAVQAALQREERGRTFVGPIKPPPPTPPHVPVTFFGYATNPMTKNRLAFFNDEDDVFILGEGGMLMNRFRLLKIENSSA